MRFLLYDVHDVTSHYASLQSGQQCDRETLDLVVDASAALCTDELAPLNAAADREGCTLIDAHHIRTPSGFKAAYDRYRESGWQGLSFPEQYGGQGLPLSLALVQSEMMAAANWTFLVFPGLSKGAINTLLAHGSDELKQRWLPPMLSGEFTGTMCLTEPQCGSDLGLMTTRST